MIPTLSITRRPGLDRDALTPRDLIVKIGDTEIQNGLQRLDLSIDVDSCSTVIVELGVDLAEIDLDALATIKAHYQATEVEAKVEAEVIPITPAYCAATGPKGFACTRPTGHEGTHRATNRNGGIEYDAWPPDPPEAS